MIRRTFLLFSSWIRGEEGRLEPLRLSQIETEVQDERDYGLDVGQDQEQESQGRVPHVDSALDKIRQVMQNLANLLAEREKEKNKNASSTFYTVYEVKVPLSEFLKLTPPTFKGVNNFEDPKFFWMRCGIGVRLWDAQIII